MRIHTPLLFIMALLSGCDVPAKTPAGTETTQTTASTQGAVVSSLIVNGDTETTFTCKSSSSGRCFYSIIASDCKDAPDDAGRKKYICETVLLEQFILAAGETKALSALPAGYKPCVSESTFPDFRSCAR